ncbi:MAG: NfeD family protein [Leptolyngbyaceae cyanobacterium MO_188.B28]|nr:NfeD family protein [Leptolyngbyaceae cyanobacterium MO_188.B28]
MSLNDFLLHNELLPFSGIGKVEETISAQQLGRVRFQATYWRARFQQPSYPQAISPGNQIRIVGREGLTLLVVPMEVKEATAYEDRC